MSQPNYPYACGAALVATPFTGVFLPLSVLRPSRGTACRVRVLPLLLPLLFIKSPFFKKIFQVPSVSLPCLFEDDIIAVT
jgi:hypothetical protein